MYMKRYFLILVLLLIGVFSFAADSNYVHHGYSVKCAKCVEQSFTTHRIPSVAWRSNEPYQKKDGKVYALYKCEYGHKYWAELR